MDLRYPVSGVPSSNPSHCFGSNLKKLNMENLSRLFAILLIVFPAKGSALPAQRKTSSGQKMTFPCLRAGCGSTQTSSSGGPVLSRFMEQPRVAGNVRLILMIL